MPKRSPKPLVRDYALTMTGQAGLVTMRESDKIFESLQPYENLWHRSDSNLLDDQILE